MCSPQGIQSSGGVGGTLQELLALSPGRQLLCGLVWRGGGGYVASSLGGDLGEWMGLGCC